MEQLLLRIKVDFRVKQEYLEKNDLVSKFETVMSFLRKENYEIIKVFVYRYICLKYTKLF